MHKRGWSSRALCAVLVIVSVTGCSSTGSKHADRVVQATTTTVPRPTPNLGHTWGVGRAEVNFVDTSRDAVAKNGTVHKGRKLPTVILYPTADRGDRATGDEHPVAKGRFPLLVFAHGVTASGPTYVPVLEKVAAAGYVIALPTFPLTSGPKGWDNLTDVQNQPADVDFVIDGLFERAARASDLLHGHLIADSVAVGGHSLGAITAMLFTNSCCRDRRVRAIVSISGLLFPAKDKSDSFDDPPTDLPIELLHGEKDSTVPYEAGSRHIFDTYTKVPRAMVSFPDKGHVDILGSPSLVPSIVAFLDLELRHDDTRWKGLTQRMRSAGDAKIEVRGGMPQPG